MCLAMNCELWTMKKTIMVVYLLVFFLCFVPNAKSLFYPFVWFAFFVCWSRLYDNLEIFEGQIRNYSWELILQSTRTASEILVFVEKLWHHQYTNKLFFALMSYESIYVRSTTVAVKPPQIDIREDGKSLTKFFGDFARLDFLKLVFIKYPTWTT